MRPLLLAVWGLTIALGCDAPAVEFDAIEFAGQRFTTCTVHVKKERLDLFLRDESGQYFKRFARINAAVQARQQKLVFAMNAGMYNPDFSAEGLFIAGGQTLAPLNLANGYGNFFLKPNGVFAVTEAGARIVETSEYPRLPERASLATQSGPLLVQHGRIHPAFKPDSTSRLFRNGVGVPSPDLAIFVITDVPVNFHEFATFFRDRLHCPDALFLDGTVSSLYAPALKRDDFRMDLGPIIGVTE